MFANYSNVLLKRTLTMINELEINDYFYFSLELCLKTTLFSKKFFLLFNVMRLE